MTGSQDEALRRIVTEVVGAAGLDLDALEVRGGGRHRRAVVVVDRDGGVELDLAADISRRISVALDEAGDAIFGGAAYTLEVTSRGVDRPLTLPRHYRRARGRRVRVSRPDGQVTTGRIAAVSESGIVLLAGGDGVTEEALSWADILSAVVEVDFTAPPAPVRARLAEIADRDGSSGPAAEQPDSDPGEGGTSS